jgi:glycosyltransferase involved in cell wall biosynthesis
MMETLFVIAAKWPPEYGGPGMYYKRHINQIAQIAERVHIVAWSRSDVIDLEGAPANVSGITLRPWRSRLGRHMSGIRLLCRLWRETGVFPRHRSGVLFTGGTISIGWRPVAICAAALGLPVLVENVLFQADDGTALLRARWSSVTRWAAARLTAFCPVSSGLRDSVLTAFPDAATVLLPYGVDLRAYAPPNTEQRLVARDWIGIPNGGLAAVSFGALHERKGQLPLVDAWLRWVERGRRHDSRLFLVGPPSDPGYVAAIERRLADASVEASQTVILAGFCPDTARYLRAADVYLSAAHAEGLPISIVEALASGVPVVCRALEGVTDDFLYGQAVAAIADWSVDAVVDALDALSASECHARASRDARAVAEARFDIANRLNMIDRLLNGSRPPACSAVS